LPRLLTIHHKGKNLMKSKLRGAAALVVVSGLFFAGCSKDDAKDSGAATETTAAAEGSAETTAAAGTDATAETTAAAGTDAAPVTEAAAPGTEAAAGAAASGEKVGVSLILKTLSNPFFVSMQKDAEAKAKELNVDLKTAAGAQDGDSPAQIAAIEAAIAAGDKGILITPSSDDVVPALKKAKEAGLLVIALDTPPGDASSVDITFATNNYTAGQLIGQWTNAQLGAAGKKKAVIAMLDLFTDKVVSVDTGRDQGFLNGMGIVKEEDKTGNAKEPKTGKYAAGGDYEIVCHEATNGNADGGKTAIEACLAKNPDINVIYTINEPAAQGAYDVMKGQGKEKDLLVVSVDGGCKPGLELVASGVIGATAQQYPGQMAAKGMQAIVDLAAGKPKPAVTPGLDFFDTGVALVTDKAAEGVTSISVAEGQKICWG
jgi:fructose transport system substrate-binding protein